MDISTLSPLAIACAAIASFLIGGVWYSPLLFARPWMVDNGFTEEDLAGANMAAIFSGSFVLSVIIAVNLAVFLGPDAGIAWGAGAGALAGVGWVVASLGILYLFERKPLRLFLVNGGYQAATFPAMGALIGAIG